jgi:O-antigen ligase
LRWSLIAAVFTFAAAMIRQKDKGSWRRQRTIVLFVVFTIWMWIQTPWALSAADHRDASILFSKFCIVLILVYSLLDSKKRLTGFFLANSLGCLYLGYLAFTTHIGGRLDGIGGPGIDDANTLGMHMAAVIFLSAAVYLSDARLSIRLAAAASIPFALNTVVASGSRGAFLALICGGIAFFILRPRAETRRALTYASLGITAFLLVAGQSFWGRMATINDAIQESEAIDTSAETRWVLARVQLQIAQRYPLGGGHKTTTFLSNRYVPVEYQAAGGGRSSHNTFLSALVDQGIPGFIIWMWIVFGLAGMSLRVRRYAHELGDNDLLWLNAAIGAAIVVVLIGGLFAPFLRAEIYVWLIASQCTIWQITQDALPIEKRA